MKQSGKSNLFLPACIAVLFAAYGVGLGVRKIRGVDAQAQSVAAANTEKQVGKPESDENEVAAYAEASSEPSAGWAEEPYEEPAEEFAARPERPEGGHAQMVVVGSEEPGGMRERFQNVDGEERARRELQAARAKTDEENLSRVQEMWPSLDEETRGKISGIIERWPTMSEEERDYYRAGNIE